MKNRKPKPFLTKNLNWLLQTLLIVFIVFIYFIPHEIIYSDCFIVRFAPFILIFFILPLLATATLIVFTKHIKISLGIAALSVLIVGPTFGLFQKYREKVELDKYGVWTNAIVVDRKHLTDHGGGSWHWGIKCTYKTNKRVYETLYHDDNDNLHPLGDTVMIIYSSKYPKIYSLGYEREK